MIDLGDLGPPKTTTAFHWKIVWNLQLFLLAALPLLLFFPRANRNRHAVLVLVPLLVSLAIVALVYEVLSWLALADMRTEFGYRYQVTGAISGLTSSSMAAAVGYAALLLMMPYVGQSRGMLVLAGGGTALVVTRVSMWLDPSTETAHVIGCVFAMTIAIVLMKGRPVARRIRFVLRLGLLLAVGFFLVLFVVSMDLLFALRYPEYLLHEADTSRVIAANVTAGLLVLLLPYLLLVFFSPFHRSRLAGVGESTGYQSSP